MKINRYTTNRFRILKNGKISLVVSTILGSTTLTYAAPSGGEVASGSATISQNAKITSINQSTQKASIDWQSFSIKADETVNFHQPDANAITLNRVIGDEKSLIGGALNANGQVWILNSNGVLFSKDAKINTSGLIATTKELSDTDFQNGNYSFSGNSTGSVINEGTIDISNSGYATLFAKEVINEGVIRAVKGDVSLVAADEISLNLNGNSLVSIVVSKGTLGALVENKQAIYTEGGDILLSATAADSLMASVVNNEGIAKASSLSDIGGDISINADIVTNSGSLQADGIKGGSVTTNASLIIDSGTTTANATSGDAGTITQNATEIFQSDTAKLSASSLQGRGGNINLLGDTAKENSKLYLSGEMSATGADGGEIDLTAHRVMLADATLESSGANNAGQIKIGGGFHGTDESIANASYTSLDSQTNITNSGLGGEIVVWSDIETLYAANITAKNSEVEVSSKENLQFDGMVESRTLLLDPKNLEVKTALSIVNPNLIAGDDFGYSVVELTNGNIVITASFSNISGGAVNVGRVYLFSPTGALISTLSGAIAEDKIGFGGVTVLSNGNYVVNSPKRGFEDSVFTGTFYTNGGAVTWADGTTGINGVVSQSNSLVGLTENGELGSGGITALTNGNYVISSPLAAQGRGYVTWADGTTGISGAVNAVNSLSGSSAGDNIGSDGVTALSNGNYVINSPYWDNGAAVDAGAVTWANGTTGISGLISDTNSLVGTKINDKVGFSDSGVTALTNGNYVVASGRWNNDAIVDAGAVTWGDGTTGISGTISVLNSLVGNYENQFLGAYDIIQALSNGNYVVAAKGWDNGATANVGAVTFGNGTTGTVGVVSADNSLIGSNVNDQVGYTLTTLSNGNYVVGSRYWDNGDTADVGAVTWGDGTNGTIGVVSAANSLIGSTADDNVGSTITALSNGDYVVGSIYWDDGATADVGAATWGNGTTGTVGVVSAENSLVGSSTENRVGQNITALSNGNYVVGSPSWDNGDTANVGAATWVDATTGTVGVVSAENSLIGSATNDHVGLETIALSNGNYVVKSRLWNNGASIQAGAVTWGDGTTGIVGVVSAQNSLVGSGSSDTVGSRITALSNGDYVVGSPYWHNGSLWDAGALTYGSGISGTVGVVGAANSLVGTRNNAQYGQYTTVLGDKFVLTDYFLNPLGGAIYFLDGISSTTFSTNPSENSFISPERITTLLNAGTAVTLQANNDITVTDAIMANNPSGNGGNLLLEAGRNINLNANIFTDNGDFKAIAGSSSALEAYTDAGTPTITIANGVTVDAGTGGIVLYANEGNFVNNSGSATPFTASSISIYLPSYTNATLNGLSVDGKRYNTAYENGLLTSGVNLYYELAPVLTVSPTTGQSVVYGGTTSGYALSGFVDGDDENDISGTALYTINGATSTSGNVVVGVHDVAYASGLSSTYGYSFVDNAGQTDELTITPKAITVSASNKVYDGTTDASFSTAGIIAGDDVVLSDATANFDTPNAGNTKIVTLTGLNMSGADTENYSIPTPLTTTADITRANATVTAASDTVTYNGQEQSVSGFSAEGLVNGEDISVLDGVTGAVATGVNAGAYATALGGEDENYNLTFVDGTLEINPEPRINEITQIVTSIVNGQALTNTDINILINSGVDVQALLNAIKQAGDNLVIVPGVALKVLNGGINLPFGMQRVLIQDNTNSNEEAEQEETL